MTIREAKHQFMLQQWVPIIEERQASGMSIRSWCKANSVRESQYFYWLKEIRKEALSKIDLPEPEPTPQLVKVDINQAPTESPRSDLLAVKESTEVSTWHTEPPPVAPVPQGCVQLQFKEATPGIPAGTKAKDLHEILKALKAL